jgi:hypothetical protein
MILKAPGFTIPTDNLCTERELADGMQMQRCRYFCDDGSPRRPATSPVRGSVGGGGPRTKAGVVSARLVRNSLSGQLVCDLSVPVLYGGRRYGIHSRNVTWVGVVLPMMAGSPARNERGDGCGE